MKITLEDLQTVINKDGVTDQYMNGANQYGVKQSATLQSYNALIKNYTAVIKTLSQYVPEEETEEQSGTWERLQLIRNQIQETEDEKAARINREMAEAQKKLDKMHEEDKKRQSETGTLH